MVGVTRYDDMLLGISDVSVKSTVSNCRIFKKEKTQTTRKKTVCTIVQQI